jgi:glycosyltransferase involved in cell wall biosynthesis
VKIALVVPGGVDAGGEERVIPALLWLVERLARRHTVHVYALAQQPEPGHWNLLGARVHGVGTGPGRRGRLLAWFAAEHRASPFDVVHAFFGGAGAYAAVLGAWHRVPVLLHLAGGEPVSMPEIGYGMRRGLRGRMALRVACATAREVTAATPYMQALAAGLGVAARRVVLGVALDRWPLAPPRPRDAGRPARLLHVGDLRPVKDQATLLRAAALLRDAAVDFELDVVGHDTTGGAIRAWPDARRVADATCWHGVLRREALRPLFERADLLLVTSRHDAGPVVVLEAAVAGVPTVGTAIGHVAEWAPDAAVAVPVGDAEALAREVATLLVDDPRRLALAHEAQRRATACDADHTAACLERLYAAARDGSSPRRAPRGTAP